MVAAAPRPRRRRSPELPLLVAGRIALGEAFGDHVVVEVVDPGLVLGAVDDPDVHDDAGAREIAGEGLGYPLEGGVVQQQLEPERLARSAIGQCLVAAPPAGLPEANERRPQIPPPPPRGGGA